MIDIYTRSIEVTGVPVSSGVAFGRAYILKHIDLEAVSQKKFPVEDITHEQKRLFTALEKTRRQLSEIQEKLQQKEGGCISQIFNAHMYILEDKRFIQKIEERFKNEGVNIEYVVADEIKKLEKEFMNIEDEVTRSRFIDVQDVYHRLLMNLLEIQHVRENPLKRLDRPVLIFAEQVIPSDITIMETKKIMGLGIEKGTKTSHVVIISKSLGIPTVINLPGITSMVRSNDLAVIDGDRGKVVVRPSETRIRIIRAKMKHELKKRKKTKIYPAGPCITADGEEVKMYANVGTAEEARKAVLYGAQGLGLIRTEIFYLSQKKMPSLHKEITYYSRFFEIFKNKPLTFRLLDIGADKKPQYIDFQEEKNPQLGKRGIRYLLDNPDLLKRQISCILKAAKQRKVRILIPFVALAEDLKSAIEIIDEICAQTGYPRRNLSVGTMIEIPSAALDIKVFAKLSDFISIGTNDLTQYVFAAEREDPRLEKYNQPKHPVILRLIEENVRMASREYGKETEVCGEIASHPLTAGILVGIGVNVLSMNAAAVPVVKDAISKRTTFQLGRIFLRCVREQRNYAYYE